MLVKHKLEFDLAKPGVEQHIEAMQKDSLTRAVEATLKCNGQLWAVPAGVKVAVAFRKKDGTSGLYDQLPDGSPAISYSDDRTVVTAVLVGTMFEAPGEAFACLTLMDDALNKLSTFPFKILVAENPSANGGASNDYYNYQDLADINDHLQGIIDGTFPIKTDVALTDPQLPANAKAVGDAIASLAHDLSAVDGSSTIVAEATGSSIAITDASDRPLRGLTLYGKTAQSGTPAPNAPVELVNVGSAGTIHVTVQGQTVTVPTPNGLPGLPVTSGGNYTDESGQRWICDCMDYGRGKYIQHIKEIVLKGTEPWYGNSATWANWTASQICKDTMPSTPVICTHYPGVPGGFPAENQISITDLGSVVIKEPAIGADSAAIKTYLAEQYAAGTPVRVRYALAEPVETPLNAQSLAAYAALHTVKPNTTILNDAGAGMKVAYVADAKAYIDNKFAALSAAIMNA